MLLPELGHRPVEIACGQPSPVRQAAQEGISGLGHPPAGVGDLIDGAGLGEHPARRALRGLLQTRCVARHSLDQHSPVSQGPATVDVAEARILPQSGRALPIGDEQVLLDGSVDA